MVESLYLGSDGNLSTFLLSSCNFYDIGHRAFKLNTFADMVIQKKSSDPPLPTWSKRVV